MAKRRGIVVLVVGVVLAVLVVILGFPREPAFRGRALSSWVGIRGDEARYTPRREYREAMHYMGTNAIPFLLRWMEGREACAMDRVRQKVRPMLAKVGVEVPAERTLSPSEFAVAFVFIGPDAEVAVPQLLSLVQGSTSPVVVARAATCLSALGEKGTWAFVTVITNPAARCRAECILATTFLMRTNAAPLVPSLILCLKDRDPKVASSAARALRNVHGRPDLVFPALTEALSHESAMVRSAAAQTLQALGPQAQPAVAPLSNPLNDMDQLIRSAATRADRRRTADDWTNFVRRPSADR